MMKNTLILLTVFLFAGMTARAGGEDGLRLLKGQSVVNVEIDWSELTIIGLPVKDWLSYRQTDQPQYDATAEWENDLKPRVYDFLSKANDEMGNISPKFIKGRDDSKYTLRLCPISFDKNGNCNIGFKLIDTQTQDVVSEFYISGKGDEIGSMSNLWGDGFKNVGKKFATLVKGAIK